MRADLPSLAIFFQRVPKFEPICSTSIGFVVWRKFGINNQLVPECQALS